MLNNKINKIATELTMALIQNDDNKLNTIDEQVENLSKKDIKKLIDVLNKNASELIDTQDDIAYCLLDFVGDYKELL